MKVINLRKSQMLAVEKIAFFVVVVVVLELLKFNLLCGKTYHLLIKCYGK